MIEQRLQQRLRVLLVAPVAFILIVVAMAVTSAHQPGVQPREALFDAFQRMNPRPAAETSSLAVIDIDDQSLAEVGPWPWPRTTLAGLVAAAEKAGAASVVVTVPVEGADPLSPEVVTQFWQSVPGSDNAIREIAQLPTNNAALAAAAATAKTALSVGQMRSPSREAGSAWARADVAASPWLSLTATGNTGYLALPTAPLTDDIDAGLSETALISVASLMADPDGKVRRSSLLWSVGEQPAPLAALAGLILAEDGLDVTASGQRLRVEGPPPETLTVGDTTIALDRRSGVRLWLPADTNRQPLPAWRVLEGEPSWTQPLAGKVVFIGESVTPGAILSTARGEMTPTMVHVQLAEQLTLGHIPQRPNWAGLAEGLLALLLGAMTIGATLYAKRRVTTSLCVVFTVLLLAGAFFAFRQSQILLDPLPAIATLVGAPIAILVTVIGDMLLRDDAVRGQFHGALPRRTMIKLQTGSGNLLRGQRREVTVLSCALRLPQPVLDRFQSRPDDFVRYVASANDMLRKTILAHDGTVDYGEDGRLLGYWNVPESLENPIEKACGCALKMIDDVNAMSENVQAAALAGDLDENSTDLGAADGYLEIGLATAPCFAGPVGRGNRNRYSVIGDAVRLATALRQRAKVYGPAIITDDIVFDALRHHYAFLDLDVVRTGEADPVRTVYGLVGNPFLKASKAFRQLADTQRELVLSWRNSDLSATAVQLQRLRGIAGVPDAYIDLYDDRLRAAQVDKDHDAPREPAAVLVL